MKIYILFNPLSNNKHGKDVVEKAKTYFADNEIEALDITEIGDIREFLSEISDEDKIVICGGDGTLNRFANDTADVDIKNDILYFAAGSGNDFNNDVKGNPEADPYVINKYITDLPTVTVKGKTCHFLNGIGYGIDGYCCEVGDIQRSKSDKPVNYAGIAIKGLLFHFKPADAVVTVDGKEYKYKKVWLAPAMNGKFYGGGMKVAPDQDRLNPDKKLSVVIMHGSGKIKTLIVFPSIFKGEHIKHKEMVDIHTGHVITVKFNKPCALQIDGETVLDVTEYTAKAGI